MRLQEVLKDREAEITALEKSLKDTSRERSPPAPVAKDLPRVHVNGKVDSTIVANLSPKTINQFDNIRKSMELHGLNGLNGNGNGYAHDAPDAGSEVNGSSETDESLDRLNELMLYVSRFPMTRSINRRSL